MGIFSKIFSSSNEDNDYDEDYENDSELDEEEDYFGVDFKNQIRDKLAELGEDSEDEELIDRISVLASRVDDNDYFTCDSCGQSRNSSEAHVTEYTNNVLCEECYEEYEGNSYSETNVCPECNGSGFSSGTSQCQVCHGEGTI